MRGAGARAFSRLAVVPVGHGEETQIAQIPQIAQRTTKSGNVLLKGPLPLFSQWFQGVSVSSGAFVNLRRKALS